MSPKAAVVFTLELPQSERELIRRHDALAATRAPDVLGKLFDRIPLKVPENVKHLFLIGAFAAVSSRMFNALDSSAALLRVSENRGSILADVRTVGKMKNSAAPIFANS